MDVHNVCNLLADNGIAVTASNVRIEARDDRWAAWLGDGRMAWFPMNADGAQRLYVERRILGLLASRCTFRVPRILYIAAAGWDVRSLVPGICDPWALYERLQGDRWLAKRIGQSIGAILTEQHNRIRKEDTGGWLRTRLSWPEPWDQVESRLPDVVHDAALLHQIGRVIERCRADEGRGPGDSVLVHGDLGLHNLAIEPSTGTVEGVFDYDGAAWVDRHYDFRYLIFDCQDESLLDGALEVYEPGLGVQLDRDRIRLLNAACAIGFLAFRQGTPPETRSCGRTLAEDLAWVQYALSAAR
jgi:hypothetical protein